jgi:hypothetical protein
MRTNERGALKSVVLVLVLAATIVLLTSAAPRAAAAEEPANPLARDGRDVAPAAPGPVKQGAAIDVAEFIKPGARLIYTQTSTVAPDRPEQPVRADGGRAQHDVVAVLPDRVLAKVSGFAEGPDGKEFFQMSASAAIVTADKVGVSGGSTWAPKKTLAELKSIPGMEVTAGDFPLHGKTYKATSIRFEERDALTIRAFDTGTGLMLSESFGGGPLRNAAIPNGGLNRQIQRTTQFETYRVLDLPWLKAKAKPPAWAAKVRTMTYRGVQRVINNPAIAIPVDGEITFDEMGDNWAIGTITNSVQGQPPVKAKHVQGPASLDAYWMSPEALADLNPGVIDTDPFLGTVVRYDVQQGRLGKLGVFTHTSKNGTQMRVFAYDLADGALRLTRFVRRDMNSDLEFELTGRDAKE